ncbi:MAG: hypothetical protein M1374_06150 [Firmicutes bacterium]|nr:hypothetical protein [Bacillota bacterium]
MTKQTTIRIPDEIADQAESVARVKGVSINTLIVDSLVHEIDKVRSDKQFVTKAKKLLERDKEIIDRLAQ